MDSIFLTIERFLQGYSGWAIPLSFLGGIAVSLSPCVLPILPITVGIIAEATLDSKLKNYIISLMFVCGVTVTYTALGIIAALFGIFLGRAINSVIIYMVVGVVLILLGLCSFDIIHIAIFNIDYKPKRTLFSVFVLGLLAGLTMIPCAFPILATILSLISLRQNIVFGILCLISFSLGYGFILFLIGSSTSLVRRLSKNKNWFIIIKRVLGCVMLGVGVYFIGMVIKYL